MNICFAIKTLSHQGGGAERVLATVAGGLAKRGHIVTIITSDPPGHIPFYPLAAQVHQISLGIGNIAERSGLLDMVRRVIGIRRAVREVKPDVAVAFMHSTYIPAGLALLNTGVPLIASEHNVPEHYQDRLLERILLQSMPLVARKITVVSLQVLESFGERLRQKMMVVENPITLMTKSAAPERKSPTAKVLLSVGRLVPQKDQLCLISAFARISKEWPEWRLRIIGEGEMRAVLEAQIDLLELRDRVDLPGISDDIYSEYMSSDLFVMPSKYESLGLATAEALLAGLPAIGFADCLGTNLLIRHNENGLLIEGQDRVGALADGLRRLMANPAERLRLANADKSWLKERFDLDVVLDRWEAVIKESIGSARQSN